MIENDAQLQQPCEALTDLYRVLGSHRKRVFPANQANYLLLARGPFEEIHKIQVQIDDYLGLSALSPDYDEDQSRRVEALREKPPEYK